VDSFRQSGVLDNIDSIFDLVDEERNENGDIRSVSGVGVAISKAVPQCYCGPNLSALKCEVWIRLKGFYNTNYIAVLDGLGTDMQPCPSLSPETEIPLYDSGVCYLQKPMLIGIGKFPENCEKGRESGMFPNIGLQSSNGSDNFRAKDTGTCAHSDTPLVAPVIPLILGINDDEGEPLYIAGRIFRRFKLGNRVNQMIQGATKIVDAVSDDKSPTHKVLGKSLVMPSNSMVGMIRVIMKRGVCLAVLRPFSDFVVDDFVMFHSAA
jgi:hypothetical protein